MINKDIDNATLVEAIVEAIRERKGQRITHVDLSSIETAATQGFVLCNGQSSMQVDAIADNIREKVEEHVGVRPYNYDGYDNSEWIVLDYGSLFVHVFRPEFRERYNLEQLWADAVIKDYPDED
ncbi:MAG: ribosome silencing factor [Muribaculaceae bacterium]|jgi:ribosome-associated protein|nr:ribosome silencing factor [Muribaculaceae bacterium]MBQ1797736.1 ribosome silencing factor [Muribaculaceae bacterium]MBQ2236011.1 ribosome silencing factor [Muribaculaceae bacterium]MBQ2484327.1 ribosome silencing factor [Muribaculaceae bacterium]MBQ4005877.1 ribosome silencing factor [Muribaculaceae bacterium]